MPRRVLPALIALAVLAAGCRSNDDAAASADLNAVVIGHAGSLTGLVQERLAPAMAAAGIAIRSDAAASLAAAQKIKDGTPTDLYATADASTNKLLMGTEHGDKVRWFATFASNAIVVAYSPVSPLLKDFEKARTGKTAWYATLEKKGVRVARSDPDLDPAGYYTVMVAQLAGLDAKDEALKERILGDDRNQQQIRMTGATDQLKSGEVDAAFLYRTNALTAGLPFIELPKRINLSDPRHTASYARASFTNRDGTVYRGTSIAYSIAPVEGAPHPEGALKVLLFLLSDAGRELARELGFLSVPVLIGGDRARVPDAIDKLVDGAWRG